MGNADPVRAATGGRSRAGVARAAQHSTGTTVAARERADHVSATLAFREAVRALRLVLVEGWGERLSSMGREWTRFEHVAEEHGARHVAHQLAKLADAHPDDALQRAEGAPAWLQELMDRSYRGRQEVGERVTRAENARDQIAAFAVHVPSGAHHRTARGLASPRLTWISACRSWMRSCEP